MPSELTKSGSHDLTEKNIPLEPRNRIHPEASLRFPRAMGQDK